MKYRMFSRLWQGNDHKTFEIYRKKWCYILLLHQTTTVAQGAKQLLALCYIFLLHQTTTTINVAGCLDVLCYIFLLHQTTTTINVAGCLDVLCYILLLHQTTTFNAAYSGESCCVISFFYIKPQRNLQALRPSCSCVISFFYIKPQLQGEVPRAGIRCVISFFYIKPQQILVSANLKDVVLYPSSTSNHNAGVF